MPDKRLNARIGLIVYLGLAVVFPALVGLIAYGVAWSTGLAEFSLPASRWFSSVGSPILSGQYAAGPYPWLSAPPFLCFAVGISVFWGKLRFQTGSVWSAVLGHSSWNAVIEGPFTSYTR